MSVLDAALRCPYCGSGDVVANEDGEYVCRSCGTVLGQSVALHATAVRARVVGTTWNFTGAKLHAVFGEVKRLRHLLNLPENCIGEAMRLAEVAVGGKKTSVAQPEALAVAALFYGCRNAGVLLPLSRLTSHVAAGRDVVKRAIWDFSKLALQNETVRYEVAILNASKRFGVDADLILGLWRKHRRKLVGKRPRVAAAALVYLAKDGAVSIGKVCHVFGVSATSVKKVLAKLRQA